MRVYLLLCLLCLSSINCLTAARDFLMAFYNGYKGTSIVLDEKCFGTEFDEQIEQIKTFWADKNYPELINALLKIESDLHDACATDELIAIIDRMEQKIKDKTILTDIVAKILKIGLHIYRAIKIGAITFENIGDVLGRIIFTMLSDKCPE